MDQRQLLDAETTLLHSNPDNHKYIVYRHLRKYKLQFSKKEMSLNINCMLCAILFHNIFSLMF